MNKSGQVQQNIQDILEFASKIKTLTSFWDSKSWLMSLLLPFMAPLLILILLIFGQMIINLLTKFISSRIEAIKLQVIIIEGYQPLGLESLTIYRVPLDRHLPSPLLTDS